MQNGALNIDALIDELAERVAAKLRAEPAQAGNGGAIRPRLLTVEQGASYLGRTKSAMQHLISAGRIPVVREGGRVFLDIRKLDIWIDENSSEAS
jgi:excisionase family DNA binding protein